jgi:transaldolase
VKKYQPVDCTTNPSLVLKAVKRPEYAFFLKKAIEAETGNPDCDSSRPFSGAPTFQRTLQWKDSM